MPHSRAYRFFCGLLLILAFTLAYAAPSHADEAAAMPKRVIHGKPENRLAVEALLNESVGDAEAESSGKVVFKLKGKFRIDKNKPVEEAVLDFIDRHGDAFGLKNPIEELKLDSKSEHNTGYTYLHFQKMLNGVPVWQQRATVHVSKEGDIDRVFLGARPIPDIDTVPLVTEDEAIDIASRDRLSNHSGQIYNSRAELYIYDGPRLAYWVRLLYNLKSWVYIVDAKTGRIITKYDNTDY